MTIGDIAGGLGEGANLIAEDLRQARIRDRQAKLQQTIQKQAFDFQRERDTAKLKSEAGIREQAISIQNRESLIASVERQANQFSQQAQLIGQLTRDDQTGAGLARVQSLLQLARRANSLALALRSGEVDPNDPNTQRLVQDLFGAEEQQRTPLAGLEERLFRIEADSGTDVLFKSPRGSITTRDIIELRASEDLKLADPTSKQKFDNFNNQRERMLGLLGEGAPTQAGKAFVKEFQAGFQGGRFGENTGLSALNTFINIASRTPVETVEQKKTRERGEETFTRGVSEDIGEIISRLRDPSSMRGAPPAEIVREREEPIPEQVERILAELNLRKEKTVDANLRSLLSDLNSSSLKVTALRSSKTRSAEERKTLQDAEKRQKKAQEALRILQPRPFQLTPTTGVQPNIGIGPGLLPGLGPTGPGAQQGGTFPLFQPLQRPQQPLR